MTKKEYAVAIAAKLKEQGVNKSVTFPKHVFHIYDDEGNKKDFWVNKSDKTVNYNSNDIESILDAGIEVLIDTLKRGEKLSIIGVGTLGLKYRKPRATIDVFNSGDWIEVSGRYIPNFTPGKELKIAAKLYELGLIDETITEDQPMDDGISEVIR